MFSTKTLVALLVFAAPFLVRADVTPLTPAPGDLFTTGSNCLITWSGDIISNTIWKNMDVELMTGSNEDMRVITNVATGLDGTVTKTYSYPCPDVTPNAQIYFYQFTAPLAPNLTWTGRFTIAPPSGATTLPTNSTTEADGTIIHWGTGALVDPSTAIAPPTFAGSNSSTSLASNSTTSESAVVTSSTAGSSTGSATTPGATSDVANSSPASSSASESPTAQPTSGAMTTYDIRILGAVAAATLVLSFIW